MSAMTDLQESMKFINLKLGEGLNGRAFPVVEYLHKEPGNITDPDYLNANGDYSASPTQFEISAFNGSDVYITSITVYVEDFGTLDAGAYGNGISLTNGIVFKIDRGGIGLIFTSSPPIFTNAHYLRQFNSPIHMATFGIGNNSYTVALNFDLNTSLPIMLRANTADRFYFELNDNFSGLEGHYFVMNGYLVNKPGAPTFRDEGAK